MYKLAALATLLPPQRVAELKKSSRREAESLKVRDSLSLNAEAPCLVVLYAP